MNRPKNKIDIAVLISGGGTTLQNLIEKKAAGELAANIIHVISSSPTARGVQIARDAEIDTSIVDFHEYDSIEEFSKTIFDSCREHKAQLVVMGGFLRRVLIPADFENRVINIHPSLIPAYCGKGFYGSRVHQAVIADKATTSGCTVHVVDDQYDHGPIIAQRSIDVSSDETAESLAEKVFSAECELLPEVINQLAAN